MPTGPKVSDKALVESKLRQPSSIETGTLGSGPEKLSPSMRIPWAVRIVRGVLWRLARRTRVLVLRAPNNDLGPASPEGCALVRVGRTASAVSHDLVKEAMRAAGEPNGLVAPRLAHGDEFFGWLIGGRVVSFGWVTYQDRTLGPILLARASGRAFFYNFHTLEEYRGRRLYPALLLAVRHVLGLEKVDEFVIDVDVRNVASARAIEKGGVCPGGPGRLPNALRPLALPWLADGNGAHGLFVVSNRLNRRIAWQICQKT